MGGTVLPLLVFRDPPPSRSQQPASPGASRSLPGPFLGVWPSPLGAGGGCSPPDLLGLQVLGRSPPLTPLVAQFPLVTLTHPQCSSARAKLLTLRPQRLHWPPPPALWAPQSSRPLAPLLHRERCPSRKSPGISRILLHSPPTPYPPPRLLGSAPPLHAFSHP